jgi:hypothetical protein
VGAIGELPTNEMRISSMPSSSMPGKNVFAFATEGVGRSVFALQICFGSCQIPSATALSPPLFVAETLGDVGEGEAQAVVDIFSRNAFEGEVKYEGTNEIGPQMDIHLLKVAFKPGKSLNPISDEWGNIETEGEALADDLGKLGTWSARWARRGTLPH